jgi:23S rRNA (cytosine1962-C5)-methyltransferase
MNPSELNQPFEPNPIPTLWAQQAEFFGNRLKKRHSHLRKWAKRNNISCFRIYDQDIPELPFQVDLYEKYLHISEVVRLTSWEDQEHTRWTDLMAVTAAKVLGIPSQHTFTKFRKKQKDKDQYEKFSQQEKIVIVKEGDLDFEVNLSDYLDTGLFLDHRQTRAMVREVALGTRVLNLFSYTGSFSVYAAAGGALSTLSVDLSNTYTGWAQRNLERNGFIGNTHKCITQDVFGFLDKAIQQKDQFDIIILDPPTFSNSKKMTTTLDVQRDHGSLIQKCFKLLSKKGLVFFSTNYKKFKIDLSFLKGFSEVQEITQQTVPEDFLRKRPHKSYILQHR